ncbi:hypothetical protein OH76DRAFT_1424182 [Lentinus brumalis]|uniref:Uncharacterized protein n=1 Tax=Lentinus brumalis TaxID=2498619 RepID=A0A371CH81_9APHY|nr:hypothetical protein OH76DRAFT_1424200 [Polyporus brumalis]RDX39645.1 hypothetical protein OH76DRAFT_1424182 [Polyporus brumalis]
MFETIPVNASDSLYILPPPSPKHLLLVARWKGSLLPTHGKKAASVRHSYSLAVWPYEPIVIGRRVKILAASPVALHAPDTPLNELDTHDPHIVGRVREIWRMVDGVASARIENECTGSLVGEVVLEFPYALQKGGRPERRVGDRESDAAMAEDCLGVMACVRPARIERECLGRRCWLETAKGT